MTRPSASRRVAQRNSECASTELCRKKDFSGLITERNHRDRCVSPGVAVLKVESILLWACEYHIGTDEFDLECEAPVESAVACHARTMFTSARPYFSLRAARRVRENARTAARVGRDVPRVVWGGGRSSR